MGKMTFEEIEDYINNIPKFAGKNSTAETGMILEHLYKTQAKIIHVAGTNGKGSVCSFLYSILQKAGCRVGFFTSPHLIDIRERIAVNGEYISQQQFIHSFNQVQEAYKAANANHPSYFEYLFLMAMHYFSGQNLDYIILETGLGGRLDATNSVKEKALTIITEIGKDHTQYLGETYSEIAFEKAGIIRANTPLVFFNKREDATKVISDCYLKICANEKMHTETLAKVSDSPASYSWQGITGIGNNNIQNIVKNNDDTISFNLDMPDKYYRLENVVISTTALYQCENASLAIAGCKALNDSKLTDEIIRDGIKAAFWPGRMQKIADNVYVDGAHNPDGIEAMLANMNNIQGEKWLMFAVVNDKDYEDMIEKIVASKAFSRIFVTMAGGQRATKAEDIGNIFKSKMEAYGYSIPVDSFDEEVEETYDYCVKCFSEYSRELCNSFEQPSAQNEHDVLKIISDNPGVTLMISGSLYLVGNVLNHIKVS